MFEVIDMCIPGTANIVDCWLLGVPYKAKILSLDILFFSWGDGAGWSKKLSSSLLLTVVGAFVVVLEILLLVEDTEAGSADKKEENMSSPAPFTFVWFVVGASIENIYIFRSICYTQYHY